MIGAAICEDHTSCFSLSTDLKLYDPLVNGLEYQVDLTKLMGSEISCNDPTNFLSTFMKMDCTSSSLSFSINLAAGPVIQELRAVGCEATT